MNRIASVIGQNVLFLSGLTIVQFCSVLFILTQIFFFLGVTVSPLTFLLAVLISLILLWYSVQDSQDDGKVQQDTFHRLVYPFISVIIICSIVFFISALFGIMFIDMSHDSNTYHKPYALFFLHGWNPVLDDRPPVVFGVQGEDYMQNTFPKAAEVIGSFFYLITGFLESVKGIHLFILFSAAILTYTAFSFILPDQRKTAACVALVAALNPVWITQSSQFYIDGFLYGCILSVVALMLISLTKGHRNSLLLSIVLGLVLILNIKGSSLLFVPVLLLMFLTLSWKFSRIETKRTLSLFLLLLMFLSLLTGFSPYITANSKYSTEFSVYFDPLGTLNVIENVDNTTVQPVQRSLPSRPVEGMHSEGTPQNSNLLVDQFNRWFFQKELFFKSLFAPVSQRYDGMKNPFLIDLTEISNLTGENRINAYGPFLGLITLLTLLTLLSILMFRKSLSEDGQIILICSLFIFISAFLHPAVWCTRYVPHLYLVFVFIPVAALTFHKPGLKVLSLLIILLLAVNALFIGIYWYNESYDQSRQYTALLDGIRESALDPVLLVHSADATRDDIFSASYRLTNAVLLQEHGITAKVGTLGLPGNQTYVVPLFFETDALVVPRSRDYSVGDTIPASVLGRYAVRGFSPTFGSHIWTDQPIAVMNLTIRDPPDNPFLILRAKPFHTDSECIDQDIWITVNNVTLPQPERVSGRSLNRLVIPLPRDLIREGTNTIQFSLPNAVRLSTGIYGLSIHSIALSEGTPVSMEMGDEDISSRIRTWYGRDD